MSTRTSTGIAYDRTGPQTDHPLVLLHAGIADRRMWDPIRPALADYDVITLDLRGYGESVDRPVGMLSPVDDVVDTLTVLGVEHSHVIGASFGAGVAVEVTLTRPDLVDSLLLCAPGGSLIPEMTSQLRAFIDAENAAMARDDLDDAVDANVAWWVDGPSRTPDIVDAGVRQLVHRMQRRAFELTATWDDLHEAELDPPAIDRLGDVQVPALVLTGALDIDAIGIAAELVSARVPQARLVEWPDVAHLPSMERPDDFVALVREWVPAL